MGSNFFHWILLSQIFFFSSNMASEVMNLTLGICSVFPLVTHSGKKFQGTFEMGFRELFPSNVFNLSVKVKDCIGFGNQVSENTYVGLVDLLNRKVQALNLTSRQVLIKVNFFDAFKTQQVDLALEIDILFPANVVEFGIATSMNEGLILSTYIPKPKNGDILLVSFQNISNMFLITLLCVLAFGIGMSYILDQRLNHTWNYKMFQVFRFFLNQHNLTRLPDYTFSSQIFKSSAILSVWILTNYLLCGFGTQLVIEDRSTLINTLEDALNNKGPCYWFREDNLLNLFQQSTSKIEKEIYQRTLYYGLNQSMVSKEDTKKSLTDIIDSGGTLITSEFKISIVEQMLCFLIIVAQNPEMRKKGLPWVSEEKFHTVLVGTAYKLGLEEHKKRFLKDWFYKFYENGLYTWYNQVGIKKTSHYFVDQVCTLRKLSFVNSRFHKFHIISVENFRSLFVIYFFFSIISAVTFIIEFFVYAFTQRPLKALDKLKFGSVKYHF